MSKSKSRRQWTPKRKIEIVLETLQSDTKLAEVCRREGLAPNMVYKWRKQLMNSAEAVFARKKDEREDPQIVRMTAENQRMKDVIAEITAPVNPSSGISTAETTMRQIAMMELISRKLAESCWDLIQRARRGAALANAIEHISACA